MTEVTLKNLYEVFDFIEKAVDWFEDLVTIGVRIRCKICGVGADITDLHKFAKGAAYIPPNPFPERSRVVDRITGKHGKVVENKIICLAEGHKHRRLITIQPDDGGGQNFCQIEEGFDSCSERFILEEEWEQQRKGIE